MLVGQHPMESLSVCLSVQVSVYLSIHLSLSFCKIESLVFSDIVHDDSWPKYLVTEGVRFLKKHNGSLNFGPKLVFLEIAYNDSLQQCLTSSWSKIHKVNFWAKGAKIGSKTRVFLLFSQVWFISFSWNWIQW